MWENISILITSWGNMIITGIQLIIPIPRKTVSFEKKLSYG